MKIAKIGLIGRGAVGGMYASMIQKVKGDNFYVLVDDTRKAKYESTPFYCNNEECHFNYVSDVKESGKLDLIFIVCKYPTLQSALITIAPFVKEDTIIVSLLNGVISENIVEETLKKGIVIHSIAQLMDAVMSDFKVSFTTTGEIVLGVVDKKRNEAMLWVAAFLEEVGIAYVIKEDIIHAQWSKLMLNCGLNQVCMVYDVPYKECQKNGLYRTLFEDVMKEVQTIAKLEGIIICDNEIEAWKKAVDKLHPQAMPSMRQDFLAKRYSEVDLFSKTMMDLAKKHNVEVPLNTMLYEKVIEIEKTYKKGD